ncbi:hypothetical protein PtrSN002B_010231 [Pyrenophora tritici-repentis]|uniref:Uncharacterized protein n=1 Tax=Pyrenophora tritici-repentis TaxID=45151 RepID=A0A2W1D999_9PLEO|nr:hypothetical protein PtrV1_13756 [Pyrenophora tritici-repentis]KAF7447217.1 hypothetical protein A1F99_086640 [Pyrenophora tritici-repentis]KAF7569567.1 hypothetical protein PtrM4_119820 [Pyrenophora tritici-repentis]KAG9382685.1 hypothetical protein A1F94_006606 [Pyrenophora tritici-repentis]KAI0571237.1 hypothetical protein Alg215_10533 [Pyrenophora tritici-repentis]
MVLFKVIETGLAEEARKISETIALLPDDQWKDVEFENDTAQKRIALSHIPGEVTSEFRTQLNKTIVW